ncbi:TIGR03571 family LLM class oxidoreductase [Sporosarcina gallistercoris]|uniref:TIGR03571 family LLM class oxidoreductase n=1 Tax=Sporosarcina gallistercoris TaxID=2762245 RepID=UPI003D2B236C
MIDFQAHSGFARTFKEHKLTLGITLPTEKKSGEVTKLTLEEQMTLVRSAEDLGFASLFVRDSPLLDPDFGDGGVLYDPFILLAYVVAHTKKLAIGTASAVTTLRHPLHLAKSAASLDEMSDQRFLFGIATGDRAIEFPAFKVERTKRPELFRESVQVMKKVWKEAYPKLQTERVGMTAGDIIPKPALAAIPIFGTGFSDQTVEWLAEHTDGWLFYAQELKKQREIIQLWRDHTPTFKPFIQPLVVDLLENPLAAPTPVPVIVGFKSGRQFLIDYLYALQDIGVNHVVLNLRSNTRPIEDILQEVGEYVLPRFPSFEHVEIQQS